MAQVQEVREFALTLDRAYEVFVHGRRKFRVGSLVFVAFSRDEEIIEFAFPKEERDGLVASDPEIFLLPAPSDLRFNWVGARGRCACRRSSCERGSLPIRAGLAEEPAPRAA